MGLYHPLIARISESGVAFGKCCFSRNIPTEETQNTLTIKFAHLYAQNRSVRHASACQERP